MIIHLQKAFISMSGWPAKNATWPIPITHDLNRTGRNLLILIVLVGFALITANPLAAQEPEKLTVSPAGSASWDDHLNFQQANPEFGKGAQGHPLYAKACAARGWRCDCPTETGDAFCTRA